MALEVILLSWRPSWRLPANLPFPRAVLLCSFYSLPWQAQGGNLLPTAPRFCLPGGRSRTATLQSFECLQDREPKLCWRLS